MLSSFTPHLKQQMALDSKARFIACITGAQGGKTTIGAVWLLREIWAAYEHGRTGDWLIVVPSFKIYEQATGVKFQQFFPSDWGSWKEQRKCFELEFGGKIFVRSADDPDSLEGITAMGAWIDEAGQIKAQAWINIQARLAINRGRCIMTTTPYTFNWLYYDILKKAATINGETNIGAASHDDAIAVFRWTSRDNPAFDSKEYDRLKGSMSKEMFEKRHGGEFTRNEGLVYKEFDPDNNVVEWFPIPDSWKRFGGIDFGFAHPTAILCIAQSPEQVDDKGVTTKHSTFYVYDEFYRRKPALKDVAAFLNEANLSYVLGDPRGAQEMSELRSHYDVRGLSPAENTVDIGIERIRVLIREGRLKFIGKNLPNTLSELEEYHYPSFNPDKPGKDKPVDGNDHAMDALKYAFSRPMAGLYQQSGTRRRSLKEKLALRQSKIERQKDSYTQY